MKASKEWNSFFISRLIFIRKIDSFIKTSSGYQGLVESIWAWAALDSSLSVGKCILRRGRFMHCIHNWWKTILVWLPWARPQITLPFDRWHVWTSYKALFKINCSCYHRDVIFPREQSPLSDTVLDICSRIWTWRVKVLASAKSGRVRSVGRVFVRLVNTTTPVTSRNLGWLSKIRHAKSSTHNWKRSASDRVEVYCVRVVHYCLVSPPWCMVYKSPYKLLKLEESPHSKDKWEIYWYPLILKLEPLIQFIGSALIKN